MHIADEATGKRLTVGEVAQLAGLKRRHVANLAKAEDIPDAKRGPDGLHFEYRDTADFRRWAEGKGRRAKERQLTRAMRRKIGMTAEHHSVIEKARPRLDETGKDMWRKLTLKEGLSPDELRESIRLGKVKNFHQTDSFRGREGVPTFEGLGMQWEFLFRKIEPVLGEWTEVEARGALAELAPIERFIKELRRDFEIAPPGAGHAESCGPSGHWRR